MQFQTCLFVITLLFGHTCAEEPLPPGCDIILGNACDDALRQCLLSNVTSRERQCRCSEEHNVCLASIDPRTCLRGGHCLLYNHNCRTFYCVEHPGRCGSCTSRADYDLDSNHGGLLYQFATSIPGGFFLACFFLFIMYVTIGCVRNTRQGKPIGWAACPNRHLWERAGRLACHCLIPKDIVAQHRRGGRATSGKGRSRRHSSRRSRKKKHKKRANKVLSKAEKTVEYSVELKSSTSLVPPHRVPARLQ